MLKKKNSRAVKNFRFVQAFDFRSQFRKITEGLANVCALMTETSDVFHVDKETVPSERPNIIAPEFIPGAKNPPKEVRGGNQRANEYLFADEHLCNKNRNRSGMFSEKRIWMKPGFDFRSHFGKLTEGLANFCALMTRTSDVFHVDEEKVPSGRPNIMTPEFIPGRKTALKEVRGGNQITKGNFVADEHLEKVCTRTGKKRRLYPEKRDWVELENDFRSQFRKLTEGLANVCALMTETSDVFLVRRVVA